VTSGPHPAVATPTDVFSGIRLKLSRARQQIDVLEADVKAFLTGGGEPYAPTINFNGTTQELTVSVKINKTPDPMWGVRVGEIVHNMRSALDHIVWELVILNTGNPPRTNQNQFPIFETEAGFNARGVRKFLHDVRADAINLIQSEQPFRTGEGVKSPLWHMRELSNADKHRTLHIVGTLLHSFNVTFPPVAESFTAEVVEILGQGVMQQDAVLWRGFLRGATKWPFAGNEIKGQLAIDIAFDQRTPAVGGWLMVGTLLEIADRTDCIAKRIANDIFKIAL